MRKTMNLALQMGKTDTSLVILGETGTGKSMLARVIHDVSARRDQPFVMVNCAAIPEQLLESEFFGYVKGAFTGAGRATGQGFWALPTGEPCFLMRLPTEPFHAASCSMPSKQKNIRPWGETGRWTATSA